MEKTFLISNSNIKRLVKNSMNIILKYDYDNYTFTTLEKKSQQNKH